jgi:hypothetical protein
LLDWLSISAEGTMRFHKNHDSTASLQEMMTALPMTAQAHAAIQRDKVAARRLVENSKEAERQRNSDLFSEK